MSETDLKSTLIAVAMRLGRSLPIGEGTEGRKESADAIGKIASAIRNSIPAKLLDDPALIIAVRTAAGLVEPELVATSMAKAELAAGLIGELAGRILLPLQT